MKYQVYRTLFGGLWRWRLRARNGKIIATSGEAYWRLGDCLDAIALVQESQDTPVSLPKTAS